MGTVSIHDDRLDLDRKLSITKIEFRNGQLWIEAETTAKISGTIQDDDVVTVYDLEGMIVTRYWLGMSCTADIHEGEKLTVFLPVFLGGPRGMALCDSSLDVKL
jgi:hypothetical protein